MTLAQFKDFKKAISDCQKENLKKALAYGKKKDWVSAEMCDNFQATYTHVLVMLKAIK